MAGVYKIICLINNFEYSGSTKRDVKKREWENFNSLKKNEHKNKKLQEDYNKYGKENFKFIIIEEFNYVDKKHLKEREDYWISSIPIEKRYNECPQSYTTKDYKWTEEQKNNLRKVSIGKNKGIKRTEEFKQKISKSMSGEKHPLYGIPCSEERKKKISKANKGKKRTEEQKDKMRNKKLSEETKEKISNSLKGRVSPNKGNKYPEEIKKKMSEDRKGLKNANSKYSKKDYELVKKLLIEGNSCKKVSELTGISTSLIKDFRNGKCWINEELGGSLKDWLKEDN